ncbi:MAG: hypothetical protein AAB554_01085 [Patescibacteria group bacterium]
MKSILIICTGLFAACSFDVSGLPAEDVPDGGADTDGGTGADASDDAAFGVDAYTGTDAAPPAATIVCSNETTDGYPKVILTFGGDIASGFLGADPGTAIDAIEYGSNQEDYVVSSSCGDTWAIPYPSGCQKRSAVWGVAPRLVLEPEVDYLNVALRYGDGTIRFGDLKTSDGDPPGFAVSGLDCRIELVDGGTGGYIRTKP